MKRLIAVVLLFHSVTAPMLAQWNTNTPGLISYTGGNVAIGKTSAAFRLDVDGGARIRNDLTGVGQYTTFRIQGPDFQHGLEIDFFGNSNYSQDPAATYGGGLGAAAIVNVNPKPLIFGTGNLPRMAIDGAGSVGIGTITPDAKLTVKGDIHTREVRVDMNGAVGPDYVFEKDYNLLPLKDLEAYINQNKHLPEVPSAAEMDTNGLNLKEMNLLLLKKIEELTLHLIEVKKEVIQLQKDNQTLKERLLQQKP
jgi:hypothetical protein